MTIKERILSALNWEVPDQIPLTVYDWLLPRSENARLLRESGVGLISRMPAHQIKLNNISITTTEYWENNYKFFRKTINTPIGEVSEVLQADISGYENTRGYEPNYWIKEYYIKVPEDYRVMEYYWKNITILDNRDAINESIRRIGNDGLVYVRVGKSPIQEMLYQLLGVERFSFDYYDRRDLFDSLHNTMSRKWEEIYELAVDAPVEVLLLGDNISADVIGQRFKEYCMPAYLRLKTVMSGSGKKLGVHCDGRLNSLVRDIAEAEFDIVEAITPPPVGDISIKEARKNWPDKSLWINFTSNVHLQSSENIERHTLQLIEEAGSKKGFVIGITEDAPLKDLERSLKIIAEILNR
jgi:hypothetical protein